MKVLITGASGQLGWELQRTVPDNMSTTALHSKQLDITSHASVEQAIQEFQPNVIINAAAYTAVDNAEKEKEKAYSVNATGAGIMAKIAHDNGIRIIQISTDFVFDGKKSSPYLPEDIPNPLSVYGASKLEGEQKVREYSNDEALILRTGWLYSAHGSNFVKTMLRLMNERDKVNVVADQVGTPTWAKGLAEAIWRFVELPDLKGTYHWTDAGVASWYDFAALIHDESVALGILKNSVTVYPVRTEDYKTAAIRPAYSVMEKTKTWAKISLQPRHWRTAMQDMLSEINDA
jgi:dTDP-4-dehydrorhamnose reductase